MPTLHQALPKYRKHKASGQAVVTLSGRDHYLGPHGTKASRLEYDRLVAEWLVCGRRPPASKESLSVSEVALLYWRFAKSYYRKHSEPTSELDYVRLSLRPLRKLYGKSLAAEFGPLALKAIQQHLINAGLTRGGINGRIERLKRLFRWAVSEELVPASVIWGLNSVPGLRRGRTNAKESPPVLPVPDAIIDATLPFLPPTVADMVRLQRLTGARPGEVCQLRPCDLDRTKDIWSFRPASHKTQHHERTRVVFFGPKAQAILAPYLLRDTQAHCFSPAESERRRRAQRRSQRVSKIRPSQRSRRKFNPQRSPHDRYDERAYRRAIHRACDKAEIPRWSPNRIRHTAATQIRSRFGLEAAQVVLGHSEADTTQIYAERDLAKAAEIMRQVG
jgi:integrase